MPLDVRFRAFRLALLHAMGQVGHTTSEVEIKRVNGMWKRLRTEATKEASVPGEAQRFFRTIFETPEWKAFSSLRSRLWRQTEAYKEKRRAYAKTYYQEVAKAKRATPEVRDRINRRRRERYEEDHP